MVRVRVNSVRTGNCDDAIDSEGSHNAVDPPLVQLSGGIDYIADGVQVFSYALGKFMGIWLHDGRHSALCPVAKRRSGGVKDNSNAQSLHLVK